MVEHYNGNTQVMNICTGCVENEIFSTYIRKKGKRGRCDFSEFHKNRNVITVKEFSDYFDKFFRENYGFGTEYLYATMDSDKPSYGTHGETLDNVVQNELLCDEQVFEEVVSALVSTLIKNEHYYPQDGEEPFYDELRNYESLEAAQKRDKADFEDYWYEHRFSFKWEDFCNSAIYKSRFFNIKEQLDDLFGKPETYALDGRRAIYEIKKGTPLFRARKLSSDLTAETVKKNPAKELNCPPAAKAISGRMNVQHIPAFYAAFSEDVAMRELQPYISEEMAVGRFTLRKKIRVFDFTIFDSIFDEKYYKKGIREPLNSTRYQVISLLQEEISKPISADNKSRDYIPTQIVTEYIQEHFDVDAIIYFSSLFSNTSKTDKAKERRNIVLLNKPFDGGKFLNALTIAKEDVVIKKLNKIDYEFGDGDLF